VEQTVTYINATSIAEELGLKVLMNSSEKTEQVSGLMNSMSVELEIEGLLNMTRVIEGAVFGKNDIRITNIDGYTLEFPPSENMLLFNNFDRPGVLKKVAEKLALAQINIGHLALGRLKNKGTALSALTLDTPLTEELLKSVAAYAELSNVCQVYKVLLVVLLYFNSRCVNECRYA
jgi:D-3-phosphoglycerate dehydrogenase